jgi:hypothetical protein
LAKIDNQSLGTVNTYRCEPRRILGSYGVGSGHGYSPDSNLLVEDVEVTGVLQGPSNATVDSFENLRLNGNPVLWDFADKFSNQVFFAKVTEMPIVPQKNTLYRYMARGIRVPCIGTVHSQTPGVWLHDLDYRHSLRTLDPLRGRFAREWSADRLTQTSNLYVDNDNNAVTEALLEIWVSDNPLSLRLYGWKAAAWSEIGYWGAIDAWGDAKAWTDGDGVAHSLKANYGVMGAAITGIGSLGYMPGNYTRVLLSVPSLSADATPSADLSTHYGGDQLLLKMVLAQSSREALRPHPVVTYVDGGLNWGPA